MDNNAALQKGIPYGVTLLQSKQVIKLYLDFALVSAFKILQDFHSKKNVGFMAFNEAGQQFRKKKIYIIPLRPSPETPSFCTISKSLVWKPWKFITAVGA